METRNAADVTLGLLYLPLVPSLEATTPLVVVAVLLSVVAAFFYIRVIVLTVHEAGEYAIRALREGAAGLTGAPAAETPTARPAT